MGTYDTLLYVVLTLQSRHRVAPRQLPWLGATPLTVVATLPLAVAVAAVWAVWRNSAWAWVLQDLQVGGRAGGREGSWHYSHVMQTGGACSGSGSGRTGVATTGLRRWSSLTKRGSHLLCSFSGRIPP